MSDFWGTAFCGHENDDGDCELGGVCDVSHMTDDPLDFCPSWVDGKKAMEEVAG
ncbi:hypothetical protein FACS1894110_10140 [Spirochaetia bacterium]|nr:hypothetical protein FACS1894110_10140 [Spirochaetia bacterium]